MPIQKQEFYEGAALHQLVRGSEGTRIVRSPPFFILDERLQVHIKYSTGKRSPWGFTFVPEEQVLLKEQSRVLPLVIGLVCGSDGIAAVPYEDYASIAIGRTTALRIACFRLHREHFEVRGPDGVLPGKIAPSEWARLVNKGSE